MKKKITVESCSECHHRDHRGGFGTPAYVPCCRASGGKVLPYTVSGFDRSRILSASYDVSKGIPDFCPLEDDDIADEPIIINTSIKDSLVKVGDYVFASRWADCDYNDPCAVGWVSEIKENYILVGEEDGSLIDGVGVRLWPNAMKITLAVGQNILQKYPSLEGSDFDPILIEKIFNPRIANEN